MGRNKKVTGVKERAGLGQCAIIDEYRAQNCLFSFGLLGKARSHFSLGAPIHRRGSRAGIVLRSINSATASAGMRTARPQFTRGSLRRASQARIVATFKPNASAACLTVSN